MKKNGSQILIKELIKHGVDTIFGYPGGAVLSIYEELYNNQDKITHILTAHEQGASHAADGYARVSGKVGVLLTTSGPGATNAVTGIANAYLDSTPLIIITGNVAVNALGKESFQEVDITSITMPIVKHNFIVKDINDLEDTIRQAFKIARSGRKRPVLIDIPKNIQTELCEYEDISPLELEVVSTDTDDLEMALKLIEESENIFIYCGGGVVASDAGEEVLSLSKKINAPIGTSLMGVTAIPHDYPLNMGMTGMHGHYASSYLKSESDLLIAIGSRFSDRATGDKEDYQSNKHIIHIDIDNSEYNKNIDANVFLCGDVKNILDKITKNVSQKTTGSWVQKAIFHKKNAKIQKWLNEYFNPESIIKKVNEYTSDDTIIATDVGQHQMWVLQFYAFQKNRTLLTSGGLGTMGFGLGAAIGGCLGAGITKTVLFTGDGSFSMNCNELLTVATQNIPVIIIIMNNGVLGMVRQWQTAFFHNHYSHTTLEKQIDFIKLGEAYGISGKKITSIEELDSILKVEIKKDSPFIIDCTINPDEKVLPMIPPGLSIKNIILE